MKRLIKKSAAMLTVMAVGAIAAHAAGDVRIATDGSSGYISKISDNGKWGVMQLAGTVEGSITPGGGLLYDLSNLKTTDISHSSGLSGVSDVTDDGTIIVGEAQAKPAYYSMTDKKWNILTMPKGGLAGRLEAVTPDGKYAAGYIISKAVSDEQDFDSYSPVMYDLTTGAIIDLPGMPEIDMQHENMHMTFISDMSADGRYLIGRVSQSYIQPPGIFSYVYDRDTATYTPIGFTENKTGPWTPTVPGTHFCDFPFMSSNGEWVVGTAYMVEEIAGSDWPKEYTAVYRYHIPTGKYDCYKGNATEENVDGVSILNDGTVTIATPSNNPYADAMVRTGDYYVSLDQILKQNYGVDFAAKTGWENTGKLICVSGDGKRIITMTGPKNFFLVDIPESLTDAAAKVDILYNYSITPADGTVMSKLKTFDIKFDRDITVLKGASNVVFASEDGEVEYTANKAEVPQDASTTLQVTFRTRALESGKNYTLTIPAGMVSIKGDASYKSKEIVVKYSGHDDTPVVLKNAYPADDATVQFIDFTDNPAVLTYDAALAPGDSPLAVLYREDEETPFCTLNLAINGNQLIVYPASKQSLYKGTDYKMVLSAGSVTDVTGGRANEEVTLHWHGGFVRTVQQDDVYVFNETCDNYENFMFYEGDCLLPADTPADWGFTKLVPWLIVRSSNETDDMAFAAHSMFRNGGKSDDWFMTPQLFIPDESCYLSFDAQSYKFDKQDRLDVYVYENSEVINTLNTPIVDDIIAKGKLVFSEVLTPGASEEGIEGDWQKVVVKLNEYVGKTVYIAFANRNEDQSAVFVDNIQVVRDLHYLVSFDHADRVVDADEINIRGNITVASDVQKFTDVAMKLRNAAGEVVSEIKETGLSLGKDDVYKFSFTDVLPLEKGKANNFTVEVSLNNVANLITGTVKNLYFEPYKKIVLEEYSGRDCGNCPQGFAAVDNIRKLYPGRLIPVIIRTYQGDPLGNSVVNYSAYLGMESVGAPSGRINRGNIIMPMISSNGDYMFSGTSLGETLWLDQVAKEVAQPAEMAVEFTSEYNAATKKAMVDAVVSNAIDATDVAVNVFAVVLENGVDAGYQSNYFASIDDPDLGDWGKGGKYSQSYVIPFTINDVARSTWGTTFNGTGGLIPNTVEGGKEYKFSFDIPITDVVSNPDNCDVVVMLIDAAKGGVLNANICKMAGGDSRLGVEEAGVGLAGDIRVAMAEGFVVATGAKALSAYTVSGQMLGMTQGDGVLTLDVSGYEGVVIVRATAADGSARTFKMIR